MKMVVDFSEKFTPPAFILEFEKDASGVLREKPWVVAAETSVVTGRYNISIEHIVLVEDITTVGTDMVPLPGSVVAEFLQNRAAFLALCQEFPAERVYVRFGGTKVRRKDAVGAPCLYRAGNYVGYIVATSTEALRKAKMFSAYVPQRLLA